MTNLRITMIKIPKVKPIPPPAPQMHDKPCTNCPSAHHPPDDESLYIATLPHKERIKTVFACGWNSTKYCHGYCKQMGITNDDLHIHEK